MGYFHQATRQFSHVHSADNPLGLRVPDQFWQKLVALLWGRHRGLTFYAPILLLAVPGWLVLIVRRNWDAGRGDVLGVVAVVLVNMFYPEWTGGWSTGPRLLVPLIPFAMLPVAAFVAGDSRGAKAATIVAIVLALAGGALMLLFQSVGGRIPPDLHATHSFRPSGRSAAGEVPLPRWRFNGERFSRNLISLIAPGSIDRLPASWQFVQFLPLVLLQAAAILGLWLFAADRSSTDEASRSRTASPASFVQLP